MTVREPAHLRDAQSAAGRPSDSFSHPRVAVVIVTFLRARHVRACLKHLALLERWPDEVIIVDASPDDATRVVVEEFPRVSYVRSATGAGNMTKSRNVGLLHVTSDIVAFIDDDACVRSGWLTGIVQGFARSDVGAVAGRVCNRIPGEEATGLNNIGRLLPGGSLTANFDADPHASIDVDHGIGANMAFRRDVLACLGGFRDDFRGTALREDTDVFLRVRALGYRVIFCPDATVDHMGAPHARGRRFDFRYVFWGRRNHALLLARNLGLGSNALRSWLKSEARLIVSDRESRVYRRAVRVLLGIGALMIGLGTSARKSRWGPTNPIRLDHQAREIRRHLTSARVD